MDNILTESQTGPGGINMLLENTRNAIIAGDIATAERYADEALAMGTEHAEAYYWKGSVLVFQKKYKEAIQSLNAAVALNEFNVGYLSLLAMAYLKSAEAEKANLVADRGLSLSPGDALCLEIKTQSLISLFRLQEANVTLQKVLALKSNGMAAGHPGNAQDLELLYEQALTIDPFKSKSRLENFNTIKMRHAGYQLLRQVLMTDRNKTVSGALILISLIAAASYFVRADATYRSFAPLLFILLWTGLGRDEKSVNASTNFGFFFGKEFRTVLQKYDRSATIKGVTLYIIALGAAVVWYYTASWIALAASIIAGGAFTLTHETFAPGTKFNTFPIKKPAKKTTAGTTPQKQASPATSQPDKATASSKRTINPDVNPYEVLYLAGIRPGLRWIIDFQLQIYWIAGISLLLIFGFPILFFLGRAFTVIPYAVLLYVELAIFLVNIFLSTLFDMLTIRILFPPEVREFISPRRVWSGVIFRTLWIILTVCLVDHIRTHNTNMLLAVIGLVVVMMVMLIRIGRRHRALQKAGVTEEDAPKRDRLIAYLRNRGAI